MCSVRAAPCMAWLTWHCCPETRTSSSPGTWTCWWAPCPRRRRCMRPAAPCCTPRASPGPSSSSRCWASLAACLRGWRCRTSTTCQQATIPL
ncbi:hypothetical protein HaLaN_07151, partial [Haematococcus lacustris]